MIMMRNIWNTIHQRYVYLALVLRAGKTHYEEPPCMMYNIEITGCVLTFIHTCICNVPNSGCLYNVPNDKLLDGFIFRDTSSTIGTAHEFNMPTAMLGASSITPLLSLGK